MRDRPDGAVLLRLARAALLDDLLEQLPQSHRYAALMVANAMAIAARELAAGEGQLNDERDSLATLYEERRGPQVSEREPETLGEALLRLTWRLAAEIRGGARDADARVYAVLRQSAIARVRETNPKVLREAGVE
ncbi:MAG: DUF6285 domain-containing protein [Kiloniellaceae bacterium]